MNISKITLFLSLLVYVIPVSSQSLLGAQYPLGIPIRSGTGPSLSLGGAGTAVENDFFGMSENPANLGTMNRALFSGLLSLQYLQVKEDSHDNLHVSFQPKAFFFSFPLAGYGALGVAFNQLSETDLRFFKQGDITTGTIVLSTPRGLVINGGSVGWQIGYGLTVLKKLRFGLMYERMYYKNAITKFIMTSGALSDSLVDSTGILVRSNGFSGGVMYTTGKLTLGLSGKVYTRGDAEFNYQHWGTQRYFDTTYTKVKTTTDTSIIAREKFTSSTSIGEVKLPPGLALGVSYHFSPEWFIAADMDFTLWKKYHSDYPLQAQNEPDLSSAINFAVGTQFIPAPNLLTPKYYEIIQYRTGLRISKLPGAQAMESALTLGAGLPFRKGGGIIDFYIEAGRRWDKRYTNYSENFFGIQLGLNGGSKWFQSSDEGY